MYLNSETVPFSFVILSTRFANTYCIFYYVPQPLQPVLLITSSFYLGLNILLYGGILLRQLRAPKQNIHFVNAYPLAPRPRARHNNRVSLRAVRFYRVYYARQCSTFQPEWRDFPLFEFRRNRRIYKLDYVKFDSCEWLIFRNFFDEKWLYLSYFFFWRNFGYDACRFFERWFKQNKFSIIKNW